MPGVLIYFWYLKGGHLFEMGHLFWTGSLFLFWVKETGKQTCCPWILPGQNDQPSKFEEIIHLKELYIHLDIVVLLRNSDEEQFL